MKGLKRIAKFAALALVCSGLFFGNEAKAAPGVISAEVVQVKGFSDVDPAQVQQAVASSVNVEGTYTENLYDPTTGVFYNIWIPNGGSAGKPVIFCVPGINVWAAESILYGPHLVLKNGEVTPDAVIVIIQRIVRGGITYSYSKTNLSSFICNTIIGGLGTSIDKVYYYGFSQGGIDFSTFGPLYFWRAAAFSDGYTPAMSASKYCLTLKAVMYNNSSKTPSAWNKSLADQTAASLGMIEGVNYIWNVVDGIHANINEYAVVSAEGQAYWPASTNCLWLVNESNGLPNALNWLLQW